MDPIEKKMEPTGQNYRAGIRQPPDELPSLHIQSDVSHAFWMTALKECIVIPYLEKGKIYGEYFITIVETGA